MQSINKYCEVTMSFSVTRKFSRYTHVLLDSKLHTTINLGSMRLTCTLERGARYGVPIDTLQ